MSQSPADASIALTRSFGRAEDQMRPVTLVRDVLPHALGSCEVSFGQTKVLCAATIEEGLPGWRMRSHAGVDHRGVRHAALLNHHALAPRDRQAQGPLHGDRATHRPRAAHGV